MMMANSNVNFVRRLTLPNYRVVFHEQVEREFVVLNCRTPEEAESIAADMYEDGDTPDNEGIEPLDTEVEEIEDEL